MILGELVPLCEEFPRRLRRIKDTQELTNQQISDRTGVPLASVQRFFAGTTANPGFYNVIAVCKCLGASVDAAFGLGEVSESDTGAVLELRHEKEKSQLLSDELHATRRTTSVLSLALLLCIVVLLVYVLHFDIGNPDFGFFKKG